MASAMNLQLMTLFFGVFAYTTAFSQISAPECESEYQQSLDFNLALDYQGFDQTPDQGFRPLAKDCPHHAIKLIKNYIILNQSSEDSLRWHLAQLLGETGQFDEAIKFALSTTRTQQSALLWNDYVNGYIAFWQKDIKKLEQAIAILESEKGNSHKGNAMNAKLLRTFKTKLEASP